MTDETLTDRQRAYIAAVKSNTEGMIALSTGLCSGCHRCANDLGYGTGLAGMADFALAVENGDEVDESGFSNAGCDICGCSLGNTLEVYHYCDENDKIIHGWGVCPDCCCYLANGDIPPDSSLEWISPQ